ncbi:MAG: alpha/beta hydrolase, partial [Chloroflexota bacterium]
RSLGLPVEMTEGVWEPGGDMARLLRTGVGLRGQKLWQGIVEKLPALDVPTLIVWGERDPLFPVSQAYATHRAIPRSRLHILPGCGHCPGIETAEELNTVLLEFLLSGERDTCL